DGSARDVHDATSPDCTRRALPLRAGHQDAPPQHPSRPDRRRRERAGRCRRQRRRRHRSGNDALKRCARERWAEPRAEARNCDRRQVPRGIILAKTMVMPTMRRALRIPFLLALLLAGCATPAQTPTAYAPLAPGTARLVI